MGIDTITFDEYQKFTRTTAIYQGAIKGCPDWVYTVLGLGEVGELQNKVKKIIRDNKGG